MVCMCCFHLICSLFFVFFRVFSCDFLWFFVFFLVFSCGFLVFFPCYVLSYRFFLLLPLVTMRILVITITLPLGDATSSVATTLTMDSTLRYSHSDYY